ncbi:MAG: type III-A CRISPR-associated protein Csm2 [Moorellaceae bacterium]
MVPQLSFKELLENKNFTEQAVWYRILTRWRVGPDSKLLEEARKMCRDYLLEEDEVLLSQAVKFWQEKGDYRQKRAVWETYLEDLKEAVLAAIDVPYRVGRAGCLSNLRIGELVEWARALGAILAADLKTTQIRRFLGEVVAAEVEAEEKGPEEFENSRVEYLRVYLAYATGRNRSAKTLLRVLEPMIKGIRPRGREGWDDFQVLVEFVRAIMAYHKFYGGTE